MSKRKKITYNELMERNDFLLSRLMEVERAVNYTHTLIISYISSNNHEKKFKNYLEKEAKIGQDNGSSTKADRTNKSGDNKAITKSSKAGNTNTQAGSKDNSENNKSTNK